MPKMTTEERFERFHQENPRLYRELRSRAVALHAVGATRTSTKALVEVVRYDHAIRTRGEEFKVNNSFTAFYARVLVADRPELASILTMRAMNPEYVPDLVNLGLRAKFDGAQARLV